MDDWIIVPLMQIGRARSDFLEVLEHVSRDRMRVEEGDEP